MSGKMLPIEVTELNECKNMITILERDQRKEPDYQHTAFAPNG